MFTLNVHKNLFDNGNSFALLQKMLEFFYGILMVILLQLSVASLFSRQKLCVFVSVVPSQLAKIANWFSFLNAFSSGLDTFLFFLYVRKDQVQEHW